LTQRRSSSIPCSAENVRIFSRSLAIAGALRWMRALSASPLRKPTAAWLSVYTTSPRTAAPHVLLARYTPAKIAASSASLALLTYGGQAPCRTIRPRADLNQTPHPAAVREKDASV
jgi:hypothetical protein